MTPTNPTPAAIRERLLNDARHEGDSRYTLRSSAMAFHKGAEFALNLAAATPLVQPAEPVARMHPEDGRVIPEATYATGARDGGASWSSVRPYTIKLHAHPATPVQATEVAPRCLVCGDTKLVPDGETCGQGGIEYSEPIQCVKDCPACVERATEVASPVVGAASEKRITAIMALVDEFAIARAHATQHAENAHAVRYRDDVRAEIERSLRLATPLQQDDAQPVRLQFEDWFGPNESLMNTHRRQGWNAAVQSGAAPLARSPLTLTTKQIAYALAQLPTPPKDGGELHDWAEALAGELWQQYGIVSPQSLERKE